MKKYTFISEYKGGTYISQYKATDLNSSLELWLQDLDSSIYSESDIIQIIEEIKNNEYKPAKIKKVDNVWCCALLSGESFLLLNIIKTV